MNKINNLTHAKRVMPGHVWICPYSSFILHKTLLTETHTMPVKPITDKFVRNVRLPNPEKGQCRQIAYLDTMQRGLALVLVVSTAAVKHFAL